ncbi:hypothetical protein FQN54_004370 [Arachnomyces sp. PD_36]|nr:hypothetical protein FQN54_004370 [Arachnomyces sp. PD_36]
MQLSISIELPVPVRLRRAILLNDVLLVKRTIKNNPLYLTNPDFDDKSNTSLHLAAIHGSVDVVQLLISFGHDSCTPIISPIGFNSAPDISLNTDLSTPLHLAATHSHASCVHHLCLAFPHTIDKPDKNGATPLMLAAQSSNPIHAPQSTGIIPPKPRPRSNSASIATSSEDTATVSCLLSHNASVTATDKVGSTALHYASAWGNLKTVRVLLAAGAPPLVRNNAKCTPADYSITMQAAAYFQSLISEYERKRVADGQQKPLPPLNVKNIDTRPQGHISPISPSQRIRGFGQASNSPSKAQGLRLVLDSEGDDDPGEGVQLTARRVGAPPRMDSRDDEYDDEDDSEDDSEDDGARLHGR